MEQDIGINSPRADTEPVSIKDGINRSGCKDRTCGFRAICFSFQFLGELSLIDADPYLKYLPSLIAGAAFHLALYTVTGQSWVRITLASLVWAESLAVNLNLKALLKNLGRSPAAGSRSSQKMSELEHVKD